METTVIIVHSLLKLKTPSQFSHFLCKWCKYPLPSLCVFLVTLPTCLFFCKTILHLIFEVRHLSLWGWINWPEASGKKEHLSHSLEKMRIMRLLYSRLLLLFDDVELHVIRTGVQFPIRVPWWKSCSISIVSQSNSGNITVIASLFLLFQEDNKGRRVSNSLWKLSSNCSALMLTSCLHLWRPDYCFHLKVCSNTTCTETDKTRGKKED
jgi:hypothetical protein